VLLLVHAGVQKGISDVGLSHKRVKLNRWSDLNGLLCCRFLFDKFGFSNRLF
jgi:hypothetical protein